MKYLTTLILLSAVIVVTAGSVEAFDGKRKGFIIGGGVSLSPYGNVDMPWPRYEDTYQAVGHDIIIGWAFSERVVLAWESAFVFFDSSEPLNSHMATGCIGSKLYYYLGRPGSSVYTMFGLGQTVFYSGYCGISAAGLGMTLGAGYEFARHFQATLHLNVGSATDSRWDSDHTLLMFSITAVAY